VADNTIQKLLDNNKEWVKSITKEKPEYFINLSKGQSPKTLWFGKLTDQSL
jgi:carbonic anhydrase